MAGFKVPTDIFNGEKWIPDELAMKNLDYYIGKVILSNNPILDISISTLINQTKKILTSFYPEIKVDFSSWNKCHDILCCSNKMINLKNNSSFHHTPKYLHTLSTNNKITKPEIDENGHPILPEIFYKYLENLFGNGNKTDTRNRIYAFMNLLAIALFGYPGKRFFLHIYGVPGSGKTVLADIIKDIAGDYCTKLSNEALAAKKYHNGSAPAADVIRMIGIRIAISDEMSPKIILSSARIKSDVGGGSLVARNLYEKVYKSVLSSLTHIMFSNDILQFDEYDPALMERLIPIHVVNSVPMHLRKSNFVNEIKKCTPEILGALTYLASKSCGLNYSLPNSIRYQSSFFLSDKNEYLSKGLSSFECFNKECIKKTNNKYVISTDALYNHYDRFCSDYKLKDVDPHNTFIKKVSEQYPSSKTRTTDRKQGYRGIKVENLMLLNYFANLCHLSNQHIHTDVFLRKMAESKNSDDFLYYTVTDVNESNYLYNK